MNEAVVAYIPVLHDGYRRFIFEHCRGRSLFVVGPSLYADYRPLAKDIRCLDAELIARSIAAWQVCSEVVVLDEEHARELACQSPLLTFPAEDVSYRIVERFFERCEVRYDTVFLRWDKTRTAQMLRPVAQHSTVDDPLIAELVELASAQAATSVDWWRQVGAALRLGDGTLLTAANEHHPHPLSAYAAGDPRANFYKGVRLELTTAVHAESQLIARAAREGLTTSGSVLYVTDFPCPPCAKLIAAAGVERLYFGTGYAVLDGEQVLEAAGVEVTQLRDEVFTAAGVPG